MIPRLGTPPRPSIAYRLRPGAYAVILGPRGVLLTKQQLDAPAEIQLPGGGIDPGEAPLPALHREIYEETGYRCRVLRRLGSYRRYTWMPDYGIHAAKLCTIYLARAGTRVGPPSEAGHWAIWAPPSRAADMLTNACDRDYLRLGLRLSGI